MVIVVLHLRQGRPEFRGAEVSGLSRVCTVWRPSRAWPPHPLSSSLIPSAGDLVCPSGGVCGPGWGPVSLAGSHEAWCSEWQGGLLTPSRPPHPRFTAEQSLRGLQFGFCLCCLFILEKTCHISHTLSPEASLLSITSLRSIIMQEHMLP